MQRQLPPIPGPRRTASSAFVSIACDSPTPARTTTPSEHELASWRPRLLSSRPRVQTPAGLNSGSFPRRQASLRAYLEMSGQYRGFKVACARLKIHPIRPCVTIRVFGVLVFRVRAEEGAYALSSLRPFRRAKFVLGLVGVSYKMRHAAYNLQPWRALGPV